MPYGRSEDYAGQFGPYVYGIPVRQKVAELRPAEVAALKDTPVTILSSEEVKAGFVAVPFRAVVYKAAGETYTVPAGSAMKLRWIGITTQDLLHIEMDPAVLGTNQAFDQPNECALVASGPSFSYTGASEVLLMKSISFDAEALGLEVYNPAATNITAATVPLVVWVWYQALPVRRF